MVMEIIKYFLFTLRLIVSNGCLQLTFCEYFSLCSSREEVHSLFYHKVKYKTVIIRLQFKVFLGVDRGRLNFIIRIIRS